MNDNIEDLQQHYLTKNFVFFIISKCRNFSANKRNVPAKYSILIKIWSSKDGKKGEGTKSTFAEKKST
ncbi:MAG: hypothetical protein ACM3PE_07875, partial [Deltaproteobacteria bacterium]